MSKYQKSYGWIICVVALAAYVIAYFVISRTSESKVQSVGGVGFYYAPVSMENIVGSRGAQKIHTAGVFIFYPIWLIDNRIFGGPEYAHIPDAGGFERAK
jgi:hypothetical protein